MKIEVHDRQSIFDLSIETMGSPEAAFILAADNNLSLTDDLFTGQVLELNAIDNRKIKTYFKDRKLKPATAITLEDNLLIGRIFDYTFELAFE